MADTIFNSPAIYGVPSIDGSIDNRSPAPPNDTRTPATLAGLIVASGATPSGLAVSLGLDPAFMLRILSRRQALPDDVVHMLATALHVDAGTVRAAAGIVTGSKGPAYRIAVPPDPLLGDTIVAQPLGRTQPVQAPVGSTVQIWTCGDGLADSSPGFAIVDRALGVLKRIQSLDLDVLQQMTIGPGGKVYAIGQSGADGSVDIAPPNTLTIAADANGLGTTGVCYEPTTNTVWGGCNHGLVRVGSINPLDSVAVPMSIGGHSADGSGVIAVGGLVYACANAGIHPSGVIAIEPSIRLPLLTWTGITLPQFLAFDSARYILVTSPVQLWSIDLNHPANPPVAVSLIGATYGSVSAASYVTHFNGAFWVSDTTGANPRIVRFYLDPANPARAIVTGDYFLGDATGNAGEVVVDADGFVWVAVPNAGQLRILDPTAISGDPTVLTIQVDGAPFGLLLV